MKPQRMKPQCMNNLIRSSLIHGGVVFLVSTVLAAAMIIISAN